MAARLIPVAGQQWGFLGVRNLFQRFYASKISLRIALVPFLCASMPKDFYVHLKMGGNIPVPSTPQNDEFFAVLS
jgi:hypothetical protein